MDSFNLEYDKVAPENHKTGVYDGVSICCDCGSTSTTILSFGIYCRVCRGLRHFMNKSTSYHPTNTVSDFD